MKTEIELFSRNPKSGKAYYAGRSDRIAVTRELIKSEIRAIRFWIAQMEVALERCEGRPKLWLVGTISGKAQTYNKLAREKFGMAKIVVIAASAIQAELLWQRFPSELSEYNLHPVAPEQQAWWPRLLCKAVKSLHEKFYGRLIS